MIKLFRTRKSTCRCRPQWPALVTEMNGHVMPCQPSEHGSPMTKLLELSARCAECAYAYAYAKGEAEAVRKRADPRSADLMHDRRVGDAVVVGQ
ncbi:hypothetical protein ACN26Y_27860 [Micromonospora sp. WMMD558]|uniref:hypothetical protein n=1 Tax=unclassified Micromonospora TaxID=2617518 RepID=UPI0012B445CA|nr:hypothetical protein [Micromonospora sp. WMMC415]QGN49729.1 hypothetical protein GKC29_24785 [Micromonospora sp. WMMC415]